jgi:hypothetical protein
MALRIAAQESRLPELSAPKSVTESDFESDATKVAEKAAASEHEPLFKKFLRFMGVS